ncbi:MAG: hypothetical protein P1U80_12735 [Pseudomonadales bacterium]|nr:hypothetical protein [Pseudomonadales bacterium]
MSEVNYGPLLGLIGVRNDDKGIGITPEPEATEESSYFETIPYTAITAATNANLQALPVLHYTGG